MARHRNVDDSELEKVTGGVDDSVQDTEKTLSQADAPFDDASDDTVIEFGDDMIVIDRES